jgi:phenylalanyl-tRNA synthetase beta chain
VVGVNLDKLSEVLSKNPIIKTYKSLLVYPETMRDLAFLVDKKVRHVDIVEALQNVDPLLQEISLFDVYEGKNIAVGQKSMAYHFTYFHSDKTLTTEEVDTAHSKVLKVLEQKFKIEVRK